MRSLLAPSLLCGLITPRLHDATGRAVESILQSAEKAALRKSAGAAVPRSAIPHPLVRSAIERLFPLIERSRDCRERDTK